MDRARLRRHTIVEWSDATKRSLALSLLLSACAAGTPTAVTKGSSGSGGTAGGTTTGSPSGEGAGAASGPGGQTGASSGSTGASPGNGTGQTTGTGGQGTSVVGPAGAGSGGLQGSDAGSSGPDGASAAGNVTFRKIRLNPDFYSEGINVGDLNRDGKIDIIAGPYWYPGPDFTSKLAFRQPRATPFDVSGDSDCYLIFVYDLSQDGWPDILSFRTAGGAEVVWYENPKGAAGNWAEHVVFSGSNDESPAFTDVDGDGKPELVTIANGYGGWAKPDWSNPQATWSFVPVTAKQSWGQYTHGLGVADVDGDGRRDLLFSEGWWGQPAMSSMTPWASHPAMFWAQEDPSESYGGAQMFVDDVDGDGDGDVVTSLQAHGWGVAWFENKGGTFTEHVIVNTRAEEAQYGVAFAQPHAVDLADIDGDGLKDIVTGKRKGAHGNGLSAAELDAPAVLYWFKLVRAPGQTPHYEPHLIDSEAGIGTQVTITDVNGDGLPDILTAARAGAFLFLRQ